jgi:hypothetical protein
VDEEFSFMKVQKTLSYTMAISAAFLMLACGKHSEDAAPADSSGASVSSGSTSPVNNPVVNPVPTPTPGITAASNCPTYPSRPTTYRYQLTGTGSSIALYNGMTTTPSEIVADQKLRVSIKPMAAGQDTNTGGSHNYSLMSARVSLLRNGAVISSYNIPSNAVDSQGFKRGISVNVKSDPTLADFSGSLYGSATYSIQVDQVMTNNKCMNICVPSNPTYFCTSDPSYCMYYGYHSIYDYWSGSNVCCYNNQLQSCQQLQCGVGPNSTNATWNLAVEVETDSTPCITP